MLAVCRTVVNWNVCAEWKRISKEDEDGAIGEGDLSLNDNIATSDQMTHKFTFYNFFVDYVKLNYILNSGSEWRDGEEGRWQGGRRRDGRLEGEPCQRHCDRMIAEIDIESS